MRRLRLLALAAPLALAACSLDSLWSPPAEAAAPEVRSPLRFESGLPLVEVRLPGDRRAWLLVDTGAGDFTLLDSKLSRELKLRHDVVHDPLMPSIHLRAALPFLEVDGMGRRDLTVYVADGIGERPELAKLGVPVEGVLGAGFFRDHCLGFDWGRGEFTATRPRVHFARHVVLPLRRATAGELHATVKVNGLDAEALVDTAAPHTIVAQEFADRVHVAYVRDADAKPRDTSLGLAVAEEGSCDHFALGTEDLAKTPLLVVERHIPNADVVLGTDVLSRYGVTFDLADHAYLVLDPKDGGVGATPLEKKSAAPPDAKAADPHE